MRIMALDLGESRTGVAISDISASLCGDSFVIHEKKKDALLQRVVRECQARGITHVVIGHPINMDASKGPRAEHSSRVACELSEMGLKTVLWDERRTTVTAAEILHRNGKHGPKNRNMIDALAAALILEGYLARQKYEKLP